MEKSCLANISVKQISENNMLDADDMLAVEEPLEIRLAYGDAGNRVEKAISITMRTPGNDMELAAGFLFTEGIIRHKQDVNLAEPVHPVENIARIVLHEHIHPNLSQADRNFFTSSSCGVCGKSSINAIKTVSIYQDEKDSISLKAENFYGLHDRLRKQQVLFDNTGGLHASALFDFSGNILLLREDVGRHNALDKVIGSAFFGDLLPLNETILVLSGRASFELIQKATMAGIRIVAAIGAPSSLAVQLAKESGITLIGFLRDRRFNIYSGWQRIEM